MAQYQNLKTAIENAVDWNNGENLITGDIMLSVLFSIINSFGADYQFAGLAIPSTNPGTPDQKIAYVAGPGVYPNFNSASIPGASMGVFLYDTEWHVSIVPIVEIINNLTSGGATKVLSAEQGKILNELITAARSYAAALNAETNAVVDAQNQEIADFEDTVRDVVDGYRPIIINGDVENAPDEEDITTDENDLLKFKNRSALNGLGYFILRRNKTFSEQVTLPNTIYEIRYDFDLGGATVSLPNACELRFVGGKLTNGKLILSPFCNIIGTSKDEFCLEDVHIVLNKRCTLQRFGMKFTNPAEDLIAFSLNSIEYDPYYSDTNILLRDMLIYPYVETDEETGEYVVPFVNAINFAADVETTNKNLAGCFNISFENIDFKGRCASAFRFDTQYSNSWFNQLSFTNCFVLGAKCGWDFNPGATGSIDCVSIANCGYQHFEDTTFAISGNKVIDLKITGTRFWDFPNATSICLFDSKCVGVTFDKIVTSGTTKPYDMIIRSGDNITANSQIRVGPQIYSTGDITKFLSEDSVITLADLFTLPDGVYLLPTTNAEKYFNNWGIRLGDNYTEPAYLSITKNYGNLVAVVYTSKRPISGSYNSGAIQVLATNRHSADAVRDAWDIHIPADSITLTMLNRISHPYPGESHFVRGGYMLPAWWDSTNNKWRGADGYVFDLRKGNTSSRPSLASGDSGYMYYDTSLKKYILWNGTAWVNVDGTAL